MDHYVYRITNIEDKKHYYGCRTSKQENLLEDLKQYKSSSTDKIFINEQFVNPDNFKYKIIKKFKNRYDCEIYEAELHKKFNVASSTKFYNKYNARSNTFIRQGSTMSDSAKEKISKFQKGKEKTKEHCKKISDTMKGRKYSEERKNNISESITGYKNHNAKIIIIFDNFNNPLYITHGNFRKKCKELKLPFTELRKTYNNFSKCYEGNISNNVLSRIKKNGNVKYTGYYARIMERINGNNI